MFVHALVGFVGEGGGEERETTGYEPLAVHAPIQWAFKGYVIKKTGCTNVNEEA